MSARRSPAPASTRGETFYSKAEVAEQFSVSVWTVARLIDSGQLAAVKFGGSIRVPQSSLDAYVAAQAVKR